MTDYTFIGEDFGMGANKLYGQAGGLEVVSQVANNGSGKITKMIGLKSGKRPMHISSRYGSFYVGASAHDYGRPVENFAFDRLTGAPEMRALLYGSLAQYQQKYGSFKKPVSMMIGLPLQMMMGDDAETYHASVKEWVKGEHTFEADGAPITVEIAKVRITSQPVGALFDFVLAEDGSIQPGRIDATQEEVGVISVGFNTLERLVIKGQRAIEKFTAGSTGGVRRLLELCNRDGAYTMGELDEKLRSGGLKKEIKDALPIWAREVNGEIEKSWGTSHRRFFKIIIVGGGALLLKDELTSQFGIKAWVAENPVLSIARGLYKLSIMKR